MSKKITATISVMTMVKAKSIYRGKKPKAGGKDKETIEFTEDNPPSAVDDVITVVDDEGTPAKLTPAKAKSVRGKTVKPNAQPSMSEGPEIFYMPAKDEEFSTVCVLLENVNPLVPGLPVGSPVFHLAAAVDFTTNGVIYWQTGDDESLAPESDPPHRFAGHRTEPEI